MTDDAVIRPHTAGLIAIRDSIPAALAKHSLPSISLCVTQGPTVIWQEAFGLADPASILPATPQTAYLLGSISKILTATAVMALVERSKIDLNDPIEAYLGDAHLNAFAGAAAEVSVRRVLTHTAGLPDHGSYVFEDQAHPLLAANESVRRFGNVVFPPGARFHYSNFGYGLLGLLLERVTGLPLQRAMEGLLFEPLEMTRSATDWRVLPAEDLARGVDDSGVPLPRYDAELPAASSFYASAADLGQFARFHLGFSGEGHDPLGETFRRLMQSPAVDIVSGRRLGMGWILIEAPAFPGGVINHDGRTCGCAVRLFLLPRAGVSVTVLCNARNPYPWTLGRDIAWVLGGDPAIQPDSPQLTPGSAAPASLRPPPRGIWRGHIATVDGEIPLKLELVGADRSMAVLGEAAPAPLADVTYAGGLLRARFASDLRLADDIRHPAAEHITLSLVAQDSSFAGEACVSFPSGARSGDDYGYYVHLDRAGSSPSTHP